MSLGDVDFTNSLCQIDCRGDRSDSDLNMDFGGQISQEWESVHSSTVGMPCLWPAIFF